MWLSEELADVASENSKKAPGTTTTIMKTFPKLDYKSSVSYNSS